MTMESSILTRAADFIWTSARLVDRQRLAHGFLAESAAGGVAAVLAYKNADGGFGNALEPDKRCPDSQPVDNEVALRVLDELGDDDVWQRPMIPRLLGFLESITTPEGGIPWVLPSVRAYPRAPWWDTGDNPPASPNPTAAIVGLLVKHEVRHSWIDRAEAYCWRVISEGATEEVHELACMLTFLENARDHARSMVELKRIGARILEKNLVELDPNATGYVRKPLDWAPTPNAWCRRLFDEATIEAHLDALVGRQQDDGGWTISWPPLSPLVELEWRGAVTVDALKTLRAYGRI